MQGYNSANLMKNYTILEKFKQKFENDERLDILDNYNSSTQTVVFAIIVDKDDKCKPHIPFFSKVTLWNACKELNKLGYKYAVKFIKYVGESSNE